jgi:hypothetical protein
MVNVRIATSLVGISVVSTSRSLYIDTETWFPYTRQTSHFETDA